MNLVSGLEVIAVASKKKIDYRGLPFHSYQEGNSFDLCRLGKWKV